MNDFWKNIAESELPTVMYGTGDGADKILAEFDRLGIKVDALFASDGFVRNRTFHGMPVRRYSDVVKEYGDDINIVMAFGSSRPEVLDNVRMLNAKHHLYIPDVPVCGENVFNADFYEKNRKEIESARDLFADDRSRVLYDNLVSCKLTGIADYLFSDVSDYGEIMRDILHPLEYRIAADIGAYTGDTAALILSYAPYIDELITVEPDEHNFSKLCMNTAGDERVERHLAAAWDCHDILRFRKGGGRGIRKGKEKTVDVSAFPFDFIAAGRRVDFIKYDVEGEEKRALNGSMKTIGRFRPELQIAVYHRSEDLFAIPKMIRDLFPDYKLYLRRELSVPAWDINLFAVSERKT